VLCSHIHHLLRDAEGKVGLAQEVKILVTEKCRAAERR
jgi:hypothetical protein